MRFLFLFVATLSLVGCGGKISDDDAAALSSAAAARARRCEAPLLVSKKTWTQGGGTRFIWACKKESDGSQKLVYVDVSETGKVEVKTRTSSLDDPVD